MPLSIKYSFNIFIAYLEMDRNIVPIEMSTVAPMDDLAVRIVFCTWGIQGHRGTCLIFPLP